MMGLKKKRRIQMIVAGFLFLGVAVVLIGYAKRDGIEFFRSPTQVSESPPPASESFRIGGLVTTGSIVKDGTRVSFEVTDGGASVPVVFVGILPDLFDEGQGMIASGKLVNGTFQATEILAKHDENYMPKEVVDALKAQGIYKAPKK